MNIDEMKDRIARAEEIQRYTENRCEALEKENAELKADNDARKFAMAMSEKVEKQLREEIEGLKKTVEHYRNEREFFIGEVEK